MHSAEELEAQNRVLRERIAQLENASMEQGDPLLRTLLEHAPGFLNVVTPEGRFLATGKVSEGFGSVVGRSVFDFAEPDQREKMRHAHREALETKRPVVYETVAFGENGEPHHTWVTRVIPVVEGQEVTALVLVPMDITERVRLERSLIESEKAMRLAVDGARMGLWRWDILRNEVTWDARMREIFEVAAAPATYELYLTLLHPDDRDLVIRMIREALETGVYRSFEHRLTAPPGRGETWILASGQVIKDEAGRPVVMLGGSLDITEQKLLSVQMQRAERVEALGHLTAGIAHNFNNLLAVILPSIEFALLHAPAPLRESLSHTLDASLQARDLVKSLMSLMNRAGTSAGESRTPCAPDEIVSRLETICKVTFPREITLVNRVSPAGSVAMPASDLEQVLLNLLFNARDAVMELVEGPRQIEVLVDAVRVPGRPPQVRIRVRDTGIGMTETVRSQVFTPFFTTKPPHKGSGLGLANALVRVRDAHGHLDCESHPGRGTTFTLLLPEATQVAPRASADEPADDADRTAETILLVDDEPMVRKVVARVLGSQNYEVLHAGSAAEAREVLRQHASRVRLILLDQSMPSESGLQALPSLRTLCAAPIVLFTGLASEVPEGIAAVLEKPARPAEMVSLVRAVLRG